MHRLRGYDYTLMITPLLLSAFGVVMIYSASMVTAVVDGLDSTYYLGKQVKWLILGILCFVITCILPYRIYQKYIKFIVFFSIVLLLLVLVFGHEANNAARSLIIAGANIQPAEFVKLSVILYLASAYSKKQSYINKFSTGVLPPLILMGGILGLIVLQPDIGTAVIILFIACTIVFSSGIHFKHIFILTFIGALVVAIAIPSMITDTRISRFTGAYQPFATPDGSGYHLIQSYLAIGVGGITGEGLGQSIQKLGYLWGAHTDFIMSIISEELGLIGVVIVISMLAVIVLRGLYISKKCKDSFGALLALGISSMVGIQAFVNLGAISGILPITGVTLPFVSYGGSSLLVLLISMGILNNIAKSVKRIDQQKVPVYSQQKESNNHNRGGKTWLN